MNNNYAKVIVKGSPITKSNFKLFNTQGRAILPYNTGKYHDRYAIYEEQIALEARGQNPGVVIIESVIAVLKVYYKSQKRHPDTNNITKSIFDGIEKSGLIVNDAQITRIVVEEYYDKENPRFELELFGESSYSLSFSVTPRESALEPINYTSTKLATKDTSTTQEKTKSTSKSKSAKVSKTSNDTLICNICSKEISKASAISANNGKMLICKSCLKKLF